MIGSPQAIGQVRRRVRSEGLASAATTGVRLRACAASSVAGAYCYTVSDMLPQRSADDTDDGWGDTVDPAVEEAAELQRLLADRPPHHDRD